MKNIYRKLSTTTPAIEQLLFERRGVNEDEYMCDDKLLNKYVVK